MANRSVTLILAALSLLAPATPGQDRPDSARSRPNVLFLIADDLGAQALGCYGNDQCRTPAIDGLARRGLRFTAAYCQFPVCGPSRAALMSGMYPQSIGVMGNGQAQRFTRLLGKRPSMAEQFKREGWHTARVSKIYHMRVPGDITAGVHGPDHARSWSERHSFRAPEWQTTGDREHLTKERLKFDRDAHYNLGFGTAFYVVRAAPAKAAKPGETQCDVQAADRAIEILRQRREVNTANAARGEAATPFFLAVGFVRPHVPLVAPAAYFDPYQPEKLRLADAVEGDRDDIPAAGRSKSSKGSGLDSDDKKRRVLQAYYASVTFMDAQVGRILKALDDQGFRDDTLVVFTSDHGYHLGEHEFWQKLSLHEESVRIPLMLAGPKIRPGETTALAQQIDIYPTLTELAGLPTPAHVQGKSLGPILRDRKAVVHDGVYCTKRKGEMLRTKTWSYLSWPDGTAELYDMAADPKQFHNLADDPAHQKTRARLAKQLAALVAGIPVAR